MSTHETARREMTEKLMPKDKAIALHLSFSPGANGVQILSGFAIALRDARKMTNRDLHTGEKLAGGGYSSWLGAIGYMALLDQIGGCFKPTGGAPAQGNSISQALSYFSSLSAAEIDALYALRNAFAHDYSLYNVNPKKPSLTHRFELDPNSPALVLLPTIPWSGDFTNMPPGTATVVNLVLFGDLVEEVCQKLFSLANTNTLDVTLPGGSDELLRRYGVLSRAH